MNYQLAFEPNRDFAKFKVENLVDNSITDFDLFIELDRHFILYSGNGYRWERDELTRLLHHGHREFYIRKSDLPKATMYDQLTKLPRITKDLPPPERIKSIEQIGAKFIQCLYEGELTEACVRKGEQISEAVVSCVSEDPSCIAHLSGLAQHDYYTYYHSIRVATYAVAIAYTMGLTDEAKLRDIALGGIFHDIGKSAIPLRVLNKAGPLTDAEWAIMRSHPVRGQEKIGETVLSHVPREIIVHHHEKRNGTGYPHGLDRNSLIYEVQIATLADIFDALTSSRSYQARRTRYEALDFIKHRLINEEVCPEAFKALVICLAKA